MIVVVVGSAAATSLFVFVVVGVECWSWRLDFLPAISHFRRRLRTTDRQLLNPLPNSDGGQTIGQLTGEFVDGQTIVQLALNPIESTVDDGGNDLQLPWQ
jgi:hypothetical protein